MKTLAQLFFLVFLFWSCDTKMDCDYTFSATALQGKVSGDAFQVLEAYEHVDQLGYFDYYRINLFGGITHDSICEGHYPDSVLRIGITVPLKEGVYELSKRSDLSVIFYDADTSYVSTCAAFSLDEVTDTSISAKLYAFFNTENEVNGRFEVKICR